MEGSTIDSLSSATKDVFGTTKVWGISLEAIIGFVAVGVVGLLLYMLRRGGVSSFLFFRDRVQTPKALRSYREGQEKATLALTHSWKLEGQSLERLIIPLHLEVRTNERIGLEQWVSKSFANPREVPRLVLLGEAGSGKSVAMGCIARVLWEVNVAKPRVPVLLTFKEIQAVQDEEALVAIVVRKMKQFQYDRGREGAALKFVEGNLKSGGIVLLLDGLDELEKQARLDVAGFLREFLTTYPEVAFVVSSRVAVWNQFPSILGDLQFSKYSIAPFTPLEVKIFVSRWEFPGEKSADQLSHLIVSKPYLLNMAENPLILTIICFLYAQPKRVLPDHRVKFYSECVDALMEKWDNAKNVDRANQFETVDKVAMLSEVAYRHLVKNEKGGEDIHRDEVLDAFADVMRKMSRPVEKRQMVLDEIVQKAELLVEMPPDQLKFPHRTFLEYFAALYFYKNHLHSDLLDLYDGDPGKWQECLLLFCGMNENLEVSDLVFGRLMERYRRDSADVMVFRTLVETALVSAGVANEVMYLAEGHLAQEIHAEIVECLGYVAANQNWVHSRRAGEILLALLERDLRIGEMVLCCIAAFPFCEKAIVENVVTRLKGVDLAIVVQHLASAAPREAARMVEAVPEDDLASVVQALIDAGELGLVFKLGYNCDKRAVRFQSVLRLAAISKTPSFLSLYSLINFEEIVDIKFREEVHRFHQRYGWPQLESNLSLMPIKGQLAFFAICHLLAKELAVEGVNQDWHQIELKQYAMNEILFVTSAILHERGHSFNRHNLLKVKVHATEIGLRKLWKHRDLGIGTIGIAIISHIYILGMMLLSIANIESINPSHDSIASIIFLVSNCSIGAALIYQYIFTLFKISYSRAINLFLSCLSPQWAFFAHDNSQFSDHWYSRITVQQILILSFSLVFHQGLIWYCYGSSLTFWVCTIITALPIVGTVFSSFISPLSRVIPNEKVRKMISKRRQKKGDVDFLANIILLVLIALLFNYMIDSKKKGI